MMLPARALTTLRGGTSTVRMLPEAITLPAPMWSLGSMKMPVPKRTPSPISTRLEKMTAGPKLQWLAWGW